MGRVIEVVYEDGAFKPLEKVDLKDGERLKMRSDTDVLKEFLEERR